MISGIGLQFLGDNELIISKFVIIKKYYLIR